MDGPASVVKTEGKNGTSYILKDAAQGYAQYPHARVVNGMIHVSGISCRRPDNTHAGVAVDPVTGEKKLDAAVQSRAVLENIERILKAVHPHACLREHAVEMVVFLVDMQDYQAMNAVYNEFFPEAAHGPSRTTVAVKQLPHPNLLVEMKCTAVLPQ
eukprot:ANDGO_04624.mRNA.1 2-aminomuconate deaminase